MHWGLEVARGVCVFLSCPWREAGQWSGAVGCLLPTLHEWRYSLPTCRQSCGCWPYSCVCVPQLMNGLRFPTTPPAAIHGLGQWQVGPLAVADSWRRA